MNRQYFLISCVGAYADSGIGTGGFLIYDGQDAITIDKYDTTGLYKFEDNYYRFIRSEKILIGYNTKGLFYQCKFPDVSDCHDILVEKNRVIFVSTNTNKILYYNFLGEFIKSKNIKGIGDAWHLNCLTKKDDRYYVSAFGEFEEHRQWNTKGCKEKGFLFDLNNDSIYVDGLSGPHTPRFIDDKLVICNSHENSLRIFNYDNTFTDINLGGFTRGICYDETNIFIGVSANRKSKNPLKSKIVVLNRKNYKVVETIEIPFAEIYDILICDKDLTDNFKKSADNFQLTEANSKIQSLIKQVELSHEQNIDLQVEISSLKDKMKLYKKVKKILNKFSK
jgi:hypothetical protein